MKILVNILIIAALALLAFYASIDIHVDSDDENKLEFVVSFDSSLGDVPQDGRLLIALATNEDEEPRFQTGIYADTQLLFGMNVNDWAPTTDVVMGKEAIGFPIKAIWDVPEGTYYAQAVLNRYHDYHLADGKVVSLPPDQGEGQHWERKPGNYYSKPIKVEISGGKDQKISIVMDQKIEPITPPSDTKYIKHIRMKSELLSKFWGEDVYVGAHILLPEGFAEHPEAHYPLMINHGHFPADFDGFRETPPDPDLKPEFNPRFGVEGVNVIEQQESYDFYRKWTSADFPRFIVIEIQHPTPYYDDSYAVNSESQGPYGDALTYELIPYIEKMFRGIGEGWARFTYGGSTGGWEAMAVQVFYPDEYNGAFVACPDPLDFRAYMNINIYEDKNAYWYDSQFMKLPRPADRDYLGNVRASHYDYNRWEAAMGDKNRSGEQYDIWEATYSPMGDDGYPVRLWDKETGVIDHKVAEFWKEHYDLRYILQRDWATLGPKLAGKLHIYVGDMDTYYLNNAVYLMEEFLESTTDPHYDGEVIYGDRFEHCWNGDSDNPNYISRMRYNTMYVDKIMKRIEKTAPAGADVTSWRYKTGGKQ